MRWLMASLFVVLALGCHKREAKGETTPSARSATASAGMPQAPTATAAFHLELGSVYERFQDLRTAIDHLSQAASLAEDQLQRVQAHSALARVKEAAGDRTGAIDALERAQAESEKVKADGLKGTSAPAGPLVGPVVDDVLLRLARLHAEAGRYDRAESLCERGLSGAREPWQREQFHRLEVELYRRAGTLEKKIVEKEKALVRAPRDESALRFLAIALAWDEMASPGAPGSTPREPRAVSSSLIRVHERLVELHPADLPERQMLQMLMERAGRVDEAVKLVTSVTSVAPTDCAGAWTTPPVSTALQGLGEGVRIRMRAGQVERARAETEKLAALVDREGVAAYLVAADLLLEQGAVERAAQLIAQAARDARSREERWQVAFARERVVARSGRAGELKSVYEQWKKLDDPCLRVAAVQREHQLATAAAGPQTSTDPSRRP
jgi:tetratricopeptide (TPR) repeat protein